MKNGLIFLLCCFSMICILNVDAASNKNREISKITGQIITNVSIVQTEYNVNKITWNKCRNVTGYKIYYSYAKNGHYKKIGVVKDNHYYHRNVKLGNVYYKIVAYRYINGKDYYGRYSKKILKVVIPPMTSLSMPEVVGDNEIKIKYKESSHVDYYQIYRGTTPNNLKYINSTRKLSYNDTNLKKYTTYYYRVRAVKWNNNKKYYSKFSNIVHETTTEANAPNKLKLVSVYGDTEAYHPDILYFENGWNGYKYWIAFTPYPNIKSSRLNGDFSKENPHIKVSNDMINWYDPVQKLNPLDIPVQNTKDKQNYNSDTDLIYNDTLDRLECFWRTYNQEKSVVIYMKYTTDGKNWSEKIQVDKTSTRKNKLLSPSFIYDNGKYKMWFVHDYTIKMKEFNTQSFKTIKGVKNIKINTKKLNVYPWHLDVIKINDKYRMIFVGTKKKNYIRNMNLYYSESSDGINWTNPVEILRPSIDKDAWDNRGIYRSSLLYKDKKWYIFYSASNKKNIKGTGIVYGDKITKLHH